MTKLFRGAILGAPASGKGTMSDRIVKKFDIHHVSTGDILRRNIQEGTELGKTADKYMTQGKLVPDVLVMKIALNELKKLENKNWLLDGFPRTLVQAEKLFMTYPLSVAVNLKVPFEVILQRVKGRWVHPGSGRVYNTDYKPPKVPGIDDVTGEPLIQRPDDREEAVMERLKVYEETTGPLLQFYKKHRILKEFEGKTTDEMWPQVEKELLQYMQPKS